MSEILEGCFHRQGEEQLKDAMADKEKRGGDDLGGCGGVGDKSGSETKEGSEVEEQDGNDETDTGGQRSCLGRCVEGMKIRRWCMLSPGGIFLE